MKDCSIATYAMLKRLLPLSAVILLTAAYQDVGRITPLDGEPLAELPGPIFSMTTTASGEPAVSAGDNHSCGVTTAGAAYCWGANRFGQLGDGTETTSDVPVAVTGGHTFQSVSAGDDHSCGVTTAGAAYCWGANRFGQLGDGTDRRSLPVRLTISNVPVAVTGGHTFQSVSAGLVYSCGVTTAGAAYCWGDNFSGQLGDGTETISSKVPVAVTGGHTLTGWRRYLKRLSRAITGRDPEWSDPGTFQSVSAGSFHSCGVTTAGAAYCWGANRFGQLGDGTETTSDVPVAVTGGHTFQSVSAGDNHSCGVTTAGAAYCWGANRSGQLGDSTETASKVPVAVSGGLTFQSVSAHGHSCGVTTGGTAYCWGSNEEGRLGDGTLTDSNVPVRVDPPF